MLTDSVLRRAKLIFEKDFATVEEDDENDDRITRQTLPDPSATIDFPVNTPFRAGHAESKHDSSPSPANTPPPNSNSDSDSDSDGERSIPTRRSKTTIPHTPEPWPHTATYVSDVQNEEAEREEHGAQKDDKHVHGSDSLLNVDIESHTDTIPDEGTAVSASVHTDELVMCDRLRGTGDATERRDAGAGIVCDGAGDDEVPARGCVVEELTDETFTVGPSSQDVTDVNLNKTNAGTTRSKMIQGDGRGNTEGLSIVKEDGDTEEVTGETFTAVASPQGGTVPHPCPGVDPFNDCPPLPVGGYFNDGVSWILHRFEMKCRNLGMADDTSCFFKQIDLIQQILQSWVQFYVPPHWTDAEKLQLADAVRSLSLNEWALACSQRREHPSTPTVQPLVAFVGMMMNKLSEMPLHPTLPAGRLIYGQRINPHEATYVKLKSYGHNYVTHQNMMATRSEGTAAERAQRYYDGVTKAVATKQLKSKTLVRTLMVQSLLGENHISCYETVPQLIYHILTDAMEASCMAAPSENAESANVLAKMDMRQVFLCLCCGEPTERLKSDEMILHRALISFIKDGVRFGAFTKFDTNGEIVQPQKPSKHPYFADLRRLVLFLTALFKHRDVPPIPASASPKDKRKMEETHKAIRTTRAHIHADNHGMPTTIVAALRSYENLKRLNEFTTTPANPWRIDGLSPRWRAVLKAFADLPIYGATGLKNAEKALTTAPPSDKKTEWSVQTGCAAHMLMFTLGHLKRQQAQLALDDDVRRADYSRAVICLVVMAGTGVRIGDTRNLTSNIFDSEDGDQLPPTKLHGAERYVTLVDTHFRKLVKAHWPKVRDDDTSERRGDKSGRRRSVERRRSDDGPRRVRYGTVTYQERLFRSQAEFDSTRQLLEEAPSMPLTIEPKYNENFVMGPRQRLHYLRKIYLVVCGEIKSTELIVTQSLGFPTTSYDDPIDRASRFCEAVQKRYMSSFQYLSVFDLRTYTVRKAEPSDFLSPRWVFVHRHSAQPLYHFNGVLRERCSDQEKEARRRFLENDKVSMGAISDVLRPFEKAVRKQTGRRGQVDYTRAIQAFRKYAMGELVSRQDAIAIHDNAKRLGWEGVPAMFSFELADVRRHITSTSDCDSEIDGDDCNADGDPFGGPSDHSSSSVAEITANLSRSRQSRSSGRPNRSEQPKTLKRDSNTIPKRDIKPKHKLRRLSEGRRGESKELRKQRELSRRHRERSRDRFQELSGDEDSDSGEEESDNGNEHSDNGEEDSHDGEEDSDNGDGNSDNGEEDSDNGVEDSDNGDIKECGPRRGLSTDSPLTAIRPRKSRSASLKGIEPIRPPGRAVHNLRKSKRDQSHSSQRNRYAADDGDNVENLCPPQRRSVAAQTASRLTQAAPEKERRVKGKIRKQHPPP